MSTAQTTLPTVFSGTNTGWEASLYAFLAEKQRRSGSNRTPDSYYRTLRHFFGNSPEVSRSGLCPRMSSPSPMASASPVVNLLPLPSAPVSPASLPSSSSSFVSISSTPIPAIPWNAPSPGPAHPAASPLHRCSSFLGSIPDSVKGRTRPRHRPYPGVNRSDARSETINLTAGDIAFDESAAFYRYTGKGGVRGRRELPQSGIGRHH